MAVARFIPRPLEMHKQEERSDTTDLETTAVARALAFHLTQRSSTHTQKVAIQNRFRLIRENKQNVQHIGQEENRFPEMLK